MNKEDVLKKLKEDKPFLEKNYGISELGLFGSYSRVISLFKVVEIINY